MIQEITDPKQFLQLTLALRELDPIGTNQIGTRASATASGIIPSEETRFWVLQDNGVIASFGMVTSTTGVFLSPSMSTSDAFAFGKYIGERIDIPASNGVSEAVVAFNDGYISVKANVAAQWTETLLVYVLETLKIPSQVSGQLRPATPLDESFLLPWVIDFCRIMHHPIENANPFYTRSLSRGSLYLWEVDGQPVGFANYHPPVETCGETIFRIGPVYVNPSFRRKGYASAMTAHLSELVQSTCSTRSRVMLYADAKNPASNKAYQNVGYVQKSQLGVYKLESLPSSA